MEGSGEGMVAVVEGLRDAGLTVTVMPSGSCRKPAKIIAIKNQSLPQIKCSVDSSTQNNNDMFPLRSNVAVQICDDRYASSYKLAHCCVSPSSPPVSLTEFPPQRSQPCRTRGNFKIGGFGSGEVSSGAIGAQYSFRSSVKLTDRGSVLLSRASCQTDPFAFSLRRYPSILPTRSISADLIQRLIKHTQAKNLSKPSKISRSVRSIPRVKERSAPRERRSKNIQTYTRTKRENNTNHETDDKLFESRERNFRVPYSGDKRITKSKDTSACYEYLQGYRRRYEVRYLDSLAKYLRDTLHQICDDTPVVCPRIQSRYNQHRRNCHEQAIPGGTDDQAASAVCCGTSSTSTEGRRGTCRKDCPRGRKLCDYCHKPLACSCIARGPQREASPSSPMIPVRSKFCQCQVEDTTGPDRITIESKNLCLCKKHVEEQKETEAEIPKPKVSEEVDDYSKRFDDEVTAWIEELPVYANDTPENAVERIRLGKELADVVKDLPRNENFDSKVMDEAIKCLDKLPIWMPETKPEQYAFKQQMVKNLLDRLRKIPEKPDIFTETIKKWVDDIDFSENIDRVEVTDEFVSALKPIALDRPNNKYEYAKHLRETIVEKLGTLPVVTKGDRNMEIKELADKLIDKLVSLPRDAVKSKDKDNSAEILQQIKNWICKENRFADYPNLMDSTDVVDLARKLTEILSKNIDDDVQYEMNNLIKAFLKDIVGIGDMIDVVKLTHSLLKELIGDSYKVDPIIRAQEVDMINQQMHNWMKNLPETRHLDPENIKDLSKVLTNEIYDNILAGGNDIDLSEWLKNVLKDLNFEMMKQRTRNLVLKEIDAFLDKAITDLPPEMKKELKEKLAEMLIKNIDEILKHEVDEDMIQDETDRMVEKLFEAIKNIFVPDFYEPEVKVGFPMVNKKTLMEEVVDNVLDKVDLKHKDDLKTNIINTLVDGTKRSQNSEGLEKEILDILRIANVPGKLAEIIAKQLTNKAKEIVLGLESQDSKLTNTLRLSKAAPSKFKDSLDYRDTDVFIPVDVLKLDEKRKGSSLTPSEAAKRLKTPADIDIFRNRLSQNLDQNFRPDDKKMENVEKRTKNTLDGRKAPKREEPLSEELKQQLKIYKIDENDKETVDCFKKELELTKKEKSPLVKLMSSLQKLSDPPKVPKKTTQVKEIAPAEYKPSPTASYSKAARKEYIEPSPEIRETVINKNDHRQRELKEIMKEKDTEHARRGNKNATEKDEEPGRYKKGDDTPRSDRIKSPPIDHGESGVSRSVARNTDDHRQRELKGTMKEKDTEHAQRGIKDVPEKDEHSGRYRKGDDRSRSDRIKGSPESSVTITGESRYKSPIDYGESGVSRSIDEARLKEGFKDLSEKRNISGPGETREPDKSKDGGKFKFGDEDEVVIQGERKNKNKQVSTAKDADMLTADKILKIDDGKGMKDKRFDVSTYTKTKDSVDFGTTKYKKDLSNQTPLETRRKTESNYRYADVKTKPLIDSKTKQDLKNSLKDYIHDLCNKVKSKISGREDLEANLINTLLDNVITGEVEGTRDDVNQILRDANISEDEARTTIEKLLAKANDLSKDVTQKLSGTKRESSVDGRSVPEHESYADTSGRSVKSVPRRPGDKASRYDKTQRTSKQDRTESTTSRVSSISEDFTEPRKVYAQKRRPTASGLLTRDEYKEEKDKTKEEKELRESILGDIENVFNNAPVALSSKTKEALKRKLSNALMEGITKPANKEDVKNKLLEILMEEPVRVISDAKSTGGARGGTRKPIHSTGEINCRIQEEISSILDESPARIPKSKKNHLKKKITDLILKNIKSDINDVRNRIIDVLTRETHLHKGVVNDLSNDIIDRIIKVIKGIELSNRQTKKQVYTLQIGSKKRTSFSANQGYFDDPPAHVRRSKRKVGSALYYEDTDGPINRTKSTVSDPNIIQDVTEYIDSIAKVQMKIPKHKVEEIKNVLESLSHKDIKALIRKDINTRRKVLDLLTKDLKLDEGDASELINSVINRFNDSEYPHSATSSQLQDVKGYLKGEILELLNKFNVKFSNEGSMRSGSRSPTFYEPPFSSTPYDGISPQLETSLSIVYDDEEISDHTLKGRNDSIEYFRRVCEVIDDWIDELPEDIRDAIDRDTMIKDLAGDIVERQKYLQLNPDAKCSKNEDLECLKYQVFRWLNNVTNVGDLTPITPKIVELRDRINDIEVPEFSVSWKKRSGVGSRRGGAKPSDSFTDKFEDWVNTLPVQFKNNEEKKQFENLKADLLTKLTELGTDASTRTIEREIDKFLRQIPLDPSKPIDLDDKIDELTKIFQATDSRKMEPAISKSRTDRRGQTNEFTTKFNDWVDSLPLKFNNDEEKKQFEKLKSDLFSSLKEMGPDGNPQAIAKEINKFLRKAPLDPSKKLDVDDKVDELTRIVQSTEPSVMDAATYESRLNADRKRPPNEFTDKFEDWMDSLPLKFKDDRAIKEFENLKSEFFSKLKELSQNASARDIENEIHRFLQKAPLDPSKEIDLDEKISELSRIVQSIDPSVMEAAKYESNTDRRRLSDAFEDKFERWVESLPLNYRNDDEKRQFENLKMDLFSKLIELGPKASTQALKHEINKFLKKAPLDPTKKVNFDDKIEELVRIVQATDPKMMEAASLESKTGWKKVPNLLYDFIERWCDDLPFDDNLDSDTIKCMKHSLANKILQKICQLNLNPEILNDDFLYEDVLRDEIDNLLSDIRGYIPIDDEQLAELKDVLVNEIKEAKQRTQNELAGQMYKQQLRDAVSRTLPLGLHLTSEDRTSLEVLKDAVADAFLNLNYSFGNEELKNKMRKKMAEEVTRFCNNYLSRHPDSPLCSNQINQDLYAALKSVSLPSVESMKSEVEHARIKDLITDWVRMLPIAEQTPTGQLTLNKMISILAKRLQDLETAGEIDGSNYSDEMKKEIKRWLHKLPILGGKDAIDIFAADLLERLRNTEHIRKFDASMRYRPDASGICSGPCHFVIKEKPKPNPCPDSCMTPPKYPPCTLSREDREHLDRIRERVLARSKSGKRCRDVSISPCMDTGSQTDVRPFGSLKSIPSVCRRIFQRPCRSTSRLRESPSCQIPFTPRSGKSVCLGTYEASEQTRGRGASHCVDSYNGSYTEVQPQIIVKEYVWDSTCNSNQQMPCDYYDEEPRSPCQRPPSCPGQFAPSPQQQTSMPQSPQMSSSDQEAKSRPEPSSSRYYREKVTRLGSLDDVKCPNMKSKPSDKFDWGSAKFDEDDFWGSCQRPMILSDEDFAPYSRERERKEERVRCRCRERVVSNYNQKKRNRNCGSSSHSCNAQSRNCSRCSAVRCPHPSYLYFRK